MMNLGFETLDQHQGALAGLTGPPLPLGQMGPWVVDLSVEGVLVSVQYSKLPK